MDIDEKRKVICLKNSRGEWVEIPFNQIIRLESEYDYITVFVKKNTTNCITTCNEYLLHATITFCEKNFKHPFFAVHQSHIINTCNIKSVTIEFRKKQAPLVTVTCLDGKSIKVADRRSKDFLKTLI